MLENKKTLTKIHIVVIILGIFFIMLSALHSNIWFDESYSVALAKHNFIDIWNITGNDVHPALYYWMLHIVYLIFGNSIVAYRLFSVLAIAILGIIGYTHIRKDFGEKTGIVFSFLTFFLPIMSTYSQEIRMYSWACLLVSITAIYGYRIYKAINNKKEIKDKIKNIVIFGIFSILSSNIHYYALAAVGLINLIVGIYIIVRQVKYKDAKSDLIIFIILALIQIALYIPWIPYLIKQVTHVGGGFWIENKFTFTSTSVEVLGFQFRRQLDTDFAFNAQTIISIIACILIYVYVGFRIYKMKKENEDIKPGIISILIYIGVILAILIISLIASPILYSRYLLVITGLFIFGLAYFIASEENKIVSAFICGLILIIGIYSNINNILINYDVSNMKQIEYIKEDIQAGDIIVYSNIGNGGVISAFFPEYEQYFYNKQHWDVEEAYKAYGPGMKTVYEYSDILDNFEGRIWLVDSEYTDLWEDFPKEGIKIIKEPMRFDTKYQNYIYNILLIQKSN